MSLESLTEIGSLSVLDAKMRIYDLLERDRRGKAIQDYMESTDFFTAPAARSHHHATEGGLARHSLEVYELAKHMAQAYPPLPELKEESLIITAVTHDFCKIGRYALADDPASDKQVGYVESLFRQARRGLPEGYKNNKAFCSALIEWCKNGCNGDAPEPGPQWKIVEDFPLGHGEKSLHIASGLIELTKEEALAIRWHAAEFDLGTMSKYAFDAAREMTPLVLIIHHADMQSAVLFGR